MDRDLRLVWLYCVIEDAVRQILGETRLRSRGPTLALRMPSCLGRIRLSLNIILLVS
jgi:hypothetical protein